LLVLDEPMNGLDPMGRQEMAQTLKELAAGGVSILISSHILAELEALCNNILVLNWGRISPPAVKKKFARHQELVRRTGDRMRRAGETGPPSL
jgi:ABC-type multidrug transport system ATPase subunit